MPPRSYATQFPSGDFTSLGFVGGAESGPVQLAPQSDAQRWLKSRALEIFNDLSTERWLLLLQKKGSISPAFLVVLVFNVVMNRLRRDASVV